MPSRYVRIALTYTRPWPLRIWAMAAAAGMLWMVCALVFMPVDFGVQATILLTGGIMTVWAGAMITSHAKEQLADPRASLVPNFRTPHLVVAAVLFAIFVVGLAML